MVLRRFRIPVPARVRMEHDRPVYVAIDRAAAHLGSRIPDPGSRLGGPVQVCAGPWRTSGHWWGDRLCVSMARTQCEAWDRDEWDVTLGDGATYRLFRERATAAWFVEGTYD